MTKLNEWQEIALEGEELEAIRNYSKKNGCTIERATPIVENYIAEVEFELDQLFDLNESDQLGLYK